MDILYKVDSDVLHPRRIPKVTSPPATHTSKCFTHAGPSNILASDYSYIFNICNKTSIKARNSSPLGRNRATFSALEITIYLRVKLAIHPTRKLQENLPVIPSCMLTLGRYPRWTFIGTT